MAIISKETIIGQLESSEEFPIALSELQGYLVSKVGPFAYFLMDAIKSDIDVNNLVGNTALGIVGGELRVRQSFIDQVLSFHGKCLDAVNAKPKITKICEKEISTTLALALNGEREVCVKSGVIDILTGTEIIEVKEVKAWKSAIGQVLAYGFEYPSHAKRIHLFGDRGGISLDMIESVCKPLGIRLTIE